MYIELDIGVKLCAPWSTGRFPVSPLSCLVHPHHRLSRIINETIQLPIEVAPAAIVEAEQWFGVERV